MSQYRIGLRDVRKLALGGLIWDSAVPGFAVRRQNGTAVAYVLKYRTVEGRQRWYTIGRHGAPWTPETARQEATRLLGEVATGKDPAAEKKTKRNAKNVAELCDKYLKDAKAGLVLKRHGKEKGKPKKASTLLIDTGRIERHIKPIIGSLPVASVTSKDIENLKKNIAEGKIEKKRIKTDKPRGLAIVKGGKTAATRTVGLLGAIFHYAIENGMRTDNPVRGVTLFKDGERKRRLSDDEYKNLGDGLRKAEDTIWPPAIAAIKLLALTGWRLSEALNLTWKEVDLANRTAPLGDSKTGFSIRPLSTAACDLLKDQSRASTLVFPATRGEVPIGGIRKFWKKIAKSGDLPPDVTPHTLRHSFGSLGSDMGYSEATIATLVGHGQHTVTSRYIHPADSVLLAAADAIANRTSDLMGFAKKE